MTEQKIQFVYTTSEKPDEPISIDIFRGEFGPEIRIEIGGRIYRGAIDIFRPLEDPKPGPRMVIDVDDDTYVYLSWPQYRGESGVENENGKFD